MSRSSVARLSDLSEQDDRVFDPVFAELLRIEQTVFVARSGVVQQRGCKRAGLVESATTGNVPVWLALAAAPAPLPAPALQLPEAPALPVIPPAPAPVPLRAATPLAPAPPLGVPPLPAARLPAAPMAMVPATLPHGMSGGSHFRGAASDK
jgi:hypothetical protein